MARRALFAALASTFVLGVGGLWAAGEYLSFPARRPVGPPPPALHAIAVSIPTASGAIAGWYARAPAGAASILLLHGVRGDRRQMLARARFLIRQGYGVLLIDLQAHGESEGEHITFGAREAQGVSAALSFLAHDRPGAKIGVIGVSLGAAALVLARPGKAIDALVIEAMYPTIEDALTNRLVNVLGAPGAGLAPLLLAQLPLRLSVKREALRPIDAVQEIACPTLVVGGSADRHTSAAETRLLYGALRAPRQLWIVEDAAHVDFHAFAPGTYEKTIGAFLRQHVGG